MSFRGSIPSSVSVAEFPVRVFYAGQPVTCTICHESGHLPRACPFSGLCLRFKQPGHVARNCTQAWGPSSSNTPVPVPVSSSSSAPVSMSVDPQVCTSVSVPSTASTSSTVSSSVSAISAPVLSVPHAIVPAPVSSVTAVSSRVPSVLPVSTSVPPSSSSTSVPVPVSSCSAASLNKDVSMSLDLVPSSRPPVSARPPSVSSADYKNFIHLVVPKVKLGSDSSTVKKQCLALAKTHRLNASLDDCARIASSLCSDDTPRVLTDVFPGDYVMQVKTTLAQELSKVPAAEFLDPSVFTDKFLSVHSVPARFCAIVFAHALAYIDRLCKK